MEIDRKTFLDSLGGPEAASKMDSEARADALESHMMPKLNQPKQSIRGEQNESGTSPNADEKISDGGRSSRADRNP